MLELILAPNPILKRPCEPVNEPDKFRYLASEMMAFCRSRGVSLSAPQVGSAVQVFVVVIPGFELAMANPLVIKEGGQYKVWEECLSIPGYQFLVKRPKLIKIRGYDLSVSPPKVRAVKVHDLLAQAVAHELDHLKGILVADVAIVHMPTSPAAKRPGSVTDLVMKVP